MLDITSALFTQHFFLFNYLAMLSETVFGLAGFLQYHLLNQKWFIVSKEN